MIGLVVLTGLMAAAVMVLFGSAFGRQQSVDADSLDSRLIESSTRDLEAADAPAPTTAHRSHPAAAHVPSAPGRPAKRGREILSLRARLAFVHTPEPGLVVLDCTLDELDDDPDGAVPPGTPFTLQLRLPETTWFAASLELLLEQWAEECRPVDVALMARDGQARARVGDGSSRVMLEMDAAAGLSV